MSLEFMRTSGSEAETAAIGRQIGRMLTSGDVLLLDGPLGAGKTLLVRAIADGLGLDTAAASSPTFVLVHIYRRARAPSRDAAPELVHIDAYRLCGTDDLETLGLEGVLASAHGGPAVAVEWAERLPPGTFAGVAPARIRIEQTGDDERELWVALPDAWSDRPGIADLRQRRAVRCPITGKTVPPESPTWPFADERARMADLYRWFSGAYTISRRPDPDDE